MFQSNQILMYAPLVLAAGLLGTVGCSSESVEEQAGATAEAAEAPVSMGQVQAPHGEVSSMMYDCADEKSFMLTIAPGVAQAALRMGDEVYQLDQQEVASGVEFTDGSITFRGKGPEAFVEKDGEPIFTDCKAAGHPQ
ncbi:MAG: MliC family protein [Gemmatimonadota bacterium]